MENVDIPGPRSMRRARSDNERRHRYNPREYSPQMHQRINNPLFPPPLDEPNELMHSRTVPEFMPALGFPPNSLDFESLAVDDERAQEVKYLSEKLHRSQSSEALKKSSIQQLERRNRQLRSLHEQDLNKVGNLQTTLETGILERNAEAEKFSKKKEEIIRQREELLLEGVDPEVVETENYKKQIDALRKRNDVLKALVDIIEQNLQAQLSEIKRQLQSEGNIAKATELHNHELANRLKVLLKEKSDLEVELETEGDKEISIEAEVTENGQDRIYLEYPPESTVIQNLLQAQVEFYFSDYNLKRDKRLLDQVCTDRKGFMLLDDVMKLSRIRQLCSEKEQLVEALRRSSILTLDEDLGIVGRPNFEKPREKEFPFRRTVFIFGIPLHENEAFVVGLLQPFGTVAKVKFDAGPDSFDRRIGDKFLQKPRVYSLFSSHGHVMEFRTSHRQEKVTHIRCFKCQRAKPTEEGFYEARDWTELLCSQCAAQKADEQTTSYYNDREQTNMKAYRHLGHVPADIHERKTALVVFASQRQASKCAYVRSRIGHKGSFATHFHHYSKVKKEIALSEQAVHDIGRRGSQEDLRNSNDNNHNNAHYFHRQSTYGPNNNSSQHRVIRATNINSRPQVSAGYRNMVSKDGHHPNYLRQVTAPVHGNDGRIHIQSRTPRSNRPQYIKKHRSNNNNNNNHNNNHNNNNLSPSNPNMENRRSRFGRQLSTDTATRQQNKPNKRTINRVRSAPQS